MLWVIIWEDGLYIDVHQKAKALGQSRQGRRVSPQECSTLPAQKNLFPSTLSDSASWGVAQHDKCAGTEV